MGQGMCRCRESQCLLQRGEKGGKEGKGQEDHGTACQGPRGTPMEEAGSGWYGKGDEAGGASSVHLINPEAPEIEAGREGGGEEERGGSQERERVGGSDEEMRGRGTEQGRGGKLQLRSQANPGSGRP